MTDEKIKLIIGSLLHDIGKVVYREGDDRRNHSISGYDFLKENGGIDDKEILSCVRYHHISALKAAKMQENDLAYIVYLADNIAAFADRRKKEGEDVSGFDLSVPLQSIFNILNENDQEYYYLPGDMEDKGNVNYPTPEKRSFSKEFYMKIRQRMLDNFKGMEWNDEYLNSLLAVMEANLTYVPSSTSKGELSDISLFDHVKLTAAIASCMYDYLNENHLKEEYYKLLKEVIPTEQWPAFIVQLSEMALPAHGGLYTDICAKEGWTEKLHAYLQKNSYISTFIKYESALLPTYREELIDRYIQHAIRMMDVHERNRRTYQNLCDYLQRAIRIGGRDKVNQAKAKLQTQYKRCRALQDELSHIS